MSESSITLHIRQIRNEGSDTKTFILERSDGARLIYKAGQFLTFLIHIHGHEVRRSYSMSSAPDVDEYPAITIKRIPNGEISRFWIDHVQVGDSFSVLPPSGRFVLEESENKNRDIVLIGAGSGITPLFSILKQALATEDSCHIILIYASRNVNNTLFWHEIESWEARFPNRLQVVHIHSQPSDEWNGIRGRINNTRLEQLINKSLRYKREDARFFICGPFDLMRSAEITLHFLGYSNAQIRKENFVITSPPPPPPISFPHKILLHFRERLQNLLIPAHTTVLEAALAAGIQLPYSCKGGRCSTCAGICKSGRIHMSVNEVLTDRDLNDGWILTCSAYVDSDDVIIEIP
ncbi:ferredoxin--NADP reductase [Dyadobacter arcticus]|uniref:Ring-1,2-phenylacetyl-CoA epoxidase subunit PaaE n=1 Tax=Dyadobacter arcticus TaxID=1078754 RepID=A0ABX0UGK5_9BACT|nr:ferredoxin--NADP reductase [Dyadobacter arcticus]NIJ51847.1 ring-1,2-phenylacetyl-CoA epoxidase subunit PaaE [Dyadobacter arcticus]